MINVAIIDDGIRCIKQDDMLFDLMVNIDGNIVANNCDIQKTDSHGSYCAEIIKRYRTEAKIGSIRVLDPKTMQGNVISLIAALEYCLDKNIQIIHLSIGSIIQKDWPLIQKVVDMLFSSGKIIIGACSNKNIYTVPACLHNVIGVSTRKDLSDDQYEINKNNCDNIDFIASSKHQINDRLTPISNSYAAPLITAKVCEYLVSHPDSGYDEVRNYLVKNALNYTSEADIVKRESLIASYPEKLDFYYNTVKMPQQRENPIICFYDFSLKKLLKIKRLFIERGYSCLIITNYLMGNFNKTEYVNFSNRTIVTNAVKALNTFYNPEILILNILNVRDIDIEKYIQVDMVCREDLIITDEGVKLTMAKDIFPQLYDLLGGDYD